MTTNQSGSFPTANRRQILKNDKYKCNICGKKGIENGGTVSLEAHHISDNPDNMDYHDPENGTTLCVVCHHYVTTRIPDDLPFDIDEIEENLGLLTYDLDILNVLTHCGPMSISEIVSQIEDSKSRNATRERLWHLMGHDQRVNQLCHPLVDQDAETSEWGLPNQIQQSARGRIPDDKNSLLQRIEDEMVRRLLDHQLSRAEVADIMDVHPRTTHHREKRALAYRLPLGDQSSESTSDTEPGGFETLETLLSKQSGSDEASTESEPELLDNTDTADELSMIVAKLDELLDLLDTEQTTVSASTATESFLSSSD